MSDPFELLPHNQAAENNKAAIFAKLSALQLTSSKILEVGSGTGQQGVYSCQNSTSIVWQPTEQATNIDALELWYEAAQQAGITNFLAPLPFSISETDWPDGDFDVIYSSNVLHIVSKALAQKLVEQVVEKLEPQQLFICYGPFKKHGMFTTPSNEAFNSWLLEQGYGGVNDIEDIVVWSCEQLKVKHLCDMPANNFLVVYEKV